MNAETGNRVASMQMVKGTASGSRHELQRAIRLHCDRTMLVKFQGCALPRKERCKKNVPPLFHLFKLFSIVLRQFLKRIMCVFAWVECGRGAVSSSDRSWSHRRPSSPAHLPSFKQRFKAPAPPPLSARLLLLSLRSVPGSPWNPSDLTFSTSAWNHPSPHFTQSSVLSTA